MGEKRGCSRTTSTGRRVSTVCQGWISSGGCPAQRQESLSSKDRGGVAELQCGRERPGDWDLEGLGFGESWSRSRSAKKSQGGRGRAWFSTWMQQMQRLGQRSELFVTIVGVASSQIESRRGVAGRARGKK